MYLVFFGYLCQYVQHSWVRSYFPHWYIICYFYKIHCLLFYCWCIHSLHQFHRQQPSCWHLLPHQYQYNCSWAFCFPVLTWNKRKVTANSAGKKQLLTKDKSSSRSPRLVMMTHSWPLPWHLPPLSWSDRLISPSVSAAAWARWHHSCSHTEHAPCPHHVTNLIITSSGFGR